ncbi:energy transducer TonB [Sphingomonas sanguinis]|jgi:protein TonB|uniref:Energy transducer TonB n=1 Tax=Sphingomonas sanguinis TaxID=33051 RepID=A0A7Y7QZ11_9SPHN|nr:energy transducer TonB [Sphingomonas sanguinis]MBZ6383348.1 energy transducer TonB [Sphingomonas sanguinis]NVP32643.1 energy transducer TonB [Sphingomonas sanguinis]
MQGGFSFREDRGKRRTAAVATTAVHAALLALLLWGPRPLSIAAPESDALAVFDVPRLPDPPPIPVPPPATRPEPVKRESQVVRPTAAGGSPRPARAPLAEQAAPAASTPAHFDPVDRLAPASDISAELPLRIGVAASDSRGTGIASGQGTGGEGRGTGNGRGDGDGPGAGRLRFALAEWIEKPPQSLIDEAFPKMARFGGVSGVAVLLCVVPEPGRPKSCSIAAERPRGRGFGPAALGLYPNFRIRPVMKGDQVIQPEVLVPVTFTIHK